MLFYLGFISCLLLTLIVFNYLLYKHNKKLIIENERQLKLNLEHFSKLSKIQDDLTTLKMRR